MSDIYPVPSTCPPPDPTPPPEPNAISVFVADPFNRPDGALGSTPIGARPWIQLPTLSPPGTVVVDNATAANDPLALAVPSAAFVDLGVGGDSFVQATAMNATLLAVNLLISHIGLPGLSAGAFLFESPFTGTWVLAEGGFVTDVDSLLVPAIGDVARITTFGDIATGWINGVAFGSVTMPPGTSLLSGAGLGQLGGDGVTVELWDDFSAGTI